MNKFWEWMEKKYYGKKDWDSEFEWKRGWIGHPTIRTFYHPATKQMLIGYMIEYFWEHKSWKELYFSFRNAIKHRNIYKELEQVIKELDSE